MPPATSQDGATAYTLHESAQLLGVSLGTIRRRIARGELRAERVHRPQGHVWQVWLEPAQDAVDPPIQPPASNLPQHPGEMQRAETMSVFLVPLLQQAMQPLVDELADTRAQLVSQAERIGRLEAEIDHMTAASLLMPQTGPTDAFVAEPTQTPATTPQRAPWWMPWRRAGV
jgi:excisionase family DNA binding protein